MIKYDATLFSIVRLGSYGHIIILQAESQIVLISDLKIWKKNIRFVLKSFRVEYRRITIHVYAV